MVPMTAGVAALGTVMAGGNLLGPQVTVHTSHRIQQVVAKLGGVLYGEGGLTVLEDAIGRDLAEVVLDQQAIGGQLQHIGVIRSLRGSSWLYLHRDEILILGHDIVRLPGQEITAGKEGSRAFLPGVGIVINDPSLR